MSYSHGVYVQDLATALTVPIQGSAGLQVIFGTAPIHLAADPYRAANEPKLCYSFAECQTALGYSDDFQTFTLCQSMDACFRVFNVAPIILVNVLDPSKEEHTTDNIEEDVPVTDGEAVYNKPYVLLPSLVVKHQETPLTAGTDYVAVHNDAGQVVLTILKEGVTDSVKVSSKSLRPSAVTKEDIVGGVDVSSGKETGLELIRQIYPALGLVPGLLLAPGWSHDPVVAAALQAKTVAINGSFTCNTLLDIAAGEDGAAVYTDVKASKEALGATSTHAIALWPMVAVGEKVYYYSAMMGALLAYTDASNGDVPYVSPSNKDLKVTATVLADGTPVRLDQEQANLLNGQGVVTAINANGFQCWGNNTAAYPATSDLKDRWIAVRRFFDWDGNNFILTYFQQVDNPANTRLIQSIVDSQNIIGNGYVARGYCAGYKVEFRSDENPITDLLNGKLTLHTSFAPYVPAETILNIREYDTTALESALTGGA